MTSYGQSAHMQINMMPGLPVESVRFIESADIASLILALLERIHRLEEAQNWPEARGVENP